MSTLNLFEFNTIFEDELTEEQININKLKDIKIKYMKKDMAVNELIKDPKIQMAFINILFNHYELEPLSKPIHMKEDINEINNDDDDVETQINDLFEFTQNPKDKISVIDFNKNIGKINKSKAKLICQKMGGTQKRNALSRNWIYMKLKHVQDEDKSKSMFKQDEESIYPNDFDEEPIKKADLNNKSKKQIKKDFNDAWNDMS